MTLGEKNEDIRQVHEARPAHSFTHGSTCTRVSPMATNAKAKRAKMLFENKNALIYGGGGAIGGAVARVFAREGAKIYTAGRTQARLDAVARDVVASAWKPA